MAAVQFTASRITILRCLRRYAKTKKLILIIFDSDYVVLRRQGLPSLSGAPSTLRGDRLGPRALTSTYRRFAASSQDQ